MSEIRPRNNPPGKLKYVIYIYICNYYIYYAMYLYTMNYIHTILIIMFQGASRAPLPPDSLGPVLIYSLDVPIDEKWMDIDHN